MEREDGLRSLSSLIKDVRASTHQHIKDDLSYGTVYADEDAGRKQAVQRLVVETLFFRVVKVSPDKQKHVHVRGALGLQHEDAVISAHQVLWASSSQNYMLLNPLAAESEREKGLPSTYVLTLQCLPFEVLREMRVWTVADSSGLEYRVHSAVIFEPPIKEEHKLFLPDLLSDLMVHKASDGAVLDRRCLNGSARDALLRALESQELVQLRDDGPRFQTWAVTPKGQASICAGNIVSKPRLALLPRLGVSFGEMYAWELIASLSIAGWQHSVHAAGKRKLQLESYKPGGPKIWYTRPNADAVSVYYLRALAGNELEVKHLESTGFYKALLEGKPYVRSIKHLRLKVFAEDDMDAGYEAPRRKKKQTPAILDGPVPPLSPPPLEDEPSEDDVSQKTESSADDEESEEEWIDENEDEDEEQPDVPAVPPPPFVPDVGLNRMTAVRDPNNGSIIGWEAVCNHPSHQFPSACRKNRRSVAAGRDEKLTIRMLAAWLAWGKDSADRGEHFDDKWKDVEKAAKNGTLPEAEEIPPVLEYGGVFEEDAHGRPGLVKRRKRQ